MHCLAATAGGSARCTLVCQKDADCIHGGVCDVGQGAMGFGLCVTAKGVAAAPCGAAGAGGLGGTSADAASVVAASPKLKQPRATAARTGGGLGAKPAAKAPWLSQ